jgi:hypothetical protein
MNQYIITKEELKELVACSWHKEMVKEIRSRPYQSERDKVLDELDKKVMKRTDELLSEFHINCGDRYIWEYRLGLGEVLDMIEELRQKAGE